MRTPSVGFVMLATLALQARADEATPLAPVTTAARDVPAHRAAFAAAWQEARACFVGAPAWDADPTFARFAQRALGFTDERCGAALDRALAIARAGRELDAGFHTAWFDVTLRLEELRGGIDAHTVAATDRAIADLGVATPTTLAAIPTLSPPATEGVRITAQTSVSIPIDHQIGSSSTDGVIGIPPVGPPLAWKATIDASGTVRADGIVAATGIESIAGALGAGDDRAILVFAKHDYAVVRSRDRGAHWSAPVALTQRSPLLGPVRVKQRRNVGPPYDLLWVKSERETMWQVIDQPAVLAAPVAIPFTLETSETCVTGGALFWISDDGQRVGVTDARGTRVLGTKLGVRGFLACAEGRVVGRTDNTIVRCDATRCDAPIRVDASVADIARDGRVLYAAQGYPHDLVVLGPTATRPARVVRVAGGVLRLRAGNDDEPVLLVHAPGGLAEVRP